MRTLAKHSALLLSLILFAASLPAGAELMAEPLPGDPRLVEFPFNDNNSYRIFARPLTVTHLVLEADERVKVLALGDTASWETSKKDNNIFFKPNKSGVSTSGTLITNKRAYQLSLISTGETGRWYQRVSFRYPNAFALVEEADDRAEVAQLNGGAAPAPAGQLSGSSRPRAESAGPEVSPGPDDKFVDLAALNFTFDIVGDANFRPVTIYDNGKSTYIKLPDDGKVPALFAIVDGEPELLDYTFAGSGVLVVPSVIATGMLKLGAREVRFYNMTKMRKTLFGSYEERNKR